MEIREGDLYFCLERRLVIVRDRDNPADCQRVFAYEVFIDLVWEEDHAYYSRKAVSNLRRKIKAAPGVPDYVKNILWHWP